VESLNSRLPRLSVGTSSDPTGRSRHMGYRQWSNGRLDQRVCAGPPWGISGAFTVGRMSTTRDLRLVLARAQQNLLDTAATDADSCLSRHPNSATVPFASPAKLFLRLQATAPTLRTFQRKHLLCWLHCYYRDQRLLSNLAATSLAARVLQPVRQFRREQFQPSISRHGLLVPPPQVEIHESHPPQ
jgi:hypothetical protein